MNKKILTLIIILFITSILLCGCNDLSVEYKKFYGKWQRTDENGNPQSTYEFFNNKTYELYSYSTNKTISGNFTIEDNKLIVYVPYPYSNLYQFSEDNTKLTLIFTQTNGEDASATYTKISNFTD